MKYLIAWIVAIVTLTSCEFNNKERMQELEGEQCDTINVTYAKVKPIFQNNCVQCHNQSYHNYDILLDSYENVKSAAQTGLLVKAVNHLPGVIPMPYQSAMLDNCSIRKVTIWINAQTPN